MKFARLLIFILVFASLNTYAYAQNDNPQNEQPKFYRAIVTDSRESSTSNTQAVKIKVLDLDLKNQTVDVEHGKYYNLTNELRVKKGDYVVLVKFSTPEQEVVLIADKYRLNYILIGSLILLGITVLMAGFKGFSSLFALGAGIFIIFQYILPQIASGANSYPVIFAGASIISVLLIYMTNGFSKKTSIAALSTLITIGLALSILYLATNLTGLSGMGSEESYFLQLNPTENINMKGLMLAGILFGTLGVLTYITTLQTKIVYKIEEKDSLISFKNLWKEGIKEGKENIPALVSVIVMAYVGAFLPLLLLLKYNQNQPLWFILNSEFFSEELVRALVGGIAVVMAVPITNLVAILFVSRNKSAS